MKGIFERVFGTKSMALKLALLAGVHLFYTAGRGDEFNSWQGLAGIFLTFPALFVLKA